MPTDDRGSFPEDHVMTRRVVATSYESDIVAVTMRLPFAPSGVRQSAAERTVTFTCNCSPHLIECEIQQQHVNTPLPEEPKLPALGVFRNQLLHHDLLLSHAPAPRA